MSHSTLYFDKFGSMFTDLDNTCSGGKISFIQEKCVAIPCLNKTPHICTHKMRSLFLNRIYCIRTALVGIFMENFILIQVHIQILAVNKIAPRLLKVKGVYTSNVHNGKKVKQR